MYAISVIMNTNKGKRYINCKECKRKRYCSKVPIPSYNFRWTCSKGHSWIEEGITLNRITAMWQDIVGDKIKDLFERDSAFYRVIKR